MTASGVAEIFVDLRLLFGILNVNDRRAVCTSNTIMTSLMIFDCDSPLSKQLPFKRKVLTNQKMGAVQRVDIFILCNHDFVWCEKARIRKFCGATFLI